VEEHRIRSPEGRQALFQEWEARYIQVDCLEFLLSVRSQAAVQEQARLVEKVEEHLD
jgi:hypothetical protein